MTGKTLAILFCHS